jgi:hypothetical protein
MVKIAHQGEEGERHSRRHSVYASETAGLVFTAFLLLILMVIRYWHAIHWSLR